MGLLVALAAGGGLALAGGIVYGTMRWVAPKPAPEGYEAPEIEIETFEQPGLVPDLEAIEAALYIGDTAKVLTLIILGLVQRGVLTILNKKPLQLEVSNPDLPLEDYEQALVDGIADDGTLPQQTIDRVMRVVSARLQKKIWNADAQETRRVYRRRADDLWDEWHRLPPARRVEREHHYYPWIILSDQYRPQPTPSTGPTMLDTVREAPLVTAAGDVACYR